MGKIQLEHGWSYLNIQIFASLLTELLEFERVNQVWTNNFFKLTIDNVHSINILKHHLPFTN